MNLRIRAEYPATDGSMPESVDVEWTEVVAGDEMADLAQTVLGMMLRAPAARLSSSPPVVAQGRLDTDVKLGAILGLQSGGIVSPVDSKGSLLSVPIRYAGPAAESMKAGTSVHLIRGAWEAAR